MIKFGTYKRLGINDIEGIEEAKKVIDGLSIKTYLIKYDEKTDFGKDVEEG